MLEGRPGFPQSLEGGSFPQAYSYCSFSGPSDNDDDDGTVANPKAPTLVLTILDPGVLSWPGGAELHFHTVWCVPAICHFISITQVLISNKFGVQWLPARSFQML